MLPIPSRLEPWAMSCEWPLRRIQAAAEDNVLLRRLARARRLLSRLASATALAPTTALPAVLRHTAFAVGQTIFGFSPYGYVPLYIRLGRASLGRWAPFTHRRAPRALLHVLLLVCVPLRVASPRDTTRGGVREREPTHQACIYLYMRVVAQ